MFFLRQNKIIFGEIADAFQPHFSCVCWSHCHHRYQEQIFWLGHENIPHVAVCNQTNVASFAFTRSWIYEHGFKSTNFPQACWKCSTHFYELNGSGLDECLSNSSNAWVIIHTHTHTHAMCRKLLQTTHFDCVSLLCQLKLNPTCFVAGKANKHCREQLAERSLPSDGGRGANLVHCGEFWSYSEQD